MTKLLFVAVAAVALGIAAPASAQVFIGADNGGAGVQLGPLGVGVGPRFSDDRYYHRRGYDANAYYGKRLPHDPLARRDAQWQRGVPHAAHLQLSQAPRHMEMSPRQRDACCGTALTKKGHLQTSHFNKGGSS
jgi:hypothetical protein